MRPTKTSEENWAIGLMTQKLVSQGHSIVTDQSVIDKPDWAFAMDGKRIAADCTYITPEKLMFWGNAKHHNFEPDVWTI